ncbi:patatin-like protein [Saccharopolyspora erythraea]|uniref:patatin-like protein n=1 Tax=Saccharopolyspora erythraea TaxID=1836 RepID=UPI001BAE0393|nr:patatin-like protein [Saccharopolyspora erythraea]QUH00298.1 patatin-like protein [Saccharopolyspora erythraea]
MATGPVQENEQELRLALAMRGGASLAVWIGGAVAEINHLRSALAEPGPAEHPWGALARLAGYDSVAVDVLAGASAGGLNATLLSASMVYGMPFDRMRRMWVRLADLEAMARPVPKLWDARPPSLLEGDGYFRTELARTMSEGVAEGDGARDLGRRADLLLTATLLDPVIERHFDGRSRPLTQERRTASFRFRHRGEAGDPLSDFGSGAEFDETVQRLAHAARTTSSFPFAFEPSRVYSSTGEVPPGEPNMSGLFSELNTTGSPYRVIDGGVLDNIPVAAAVEAIAAAPADRPTQRWLLYLNPEGAASDTERADGAGLPVASAAIRARLSQESLLSDLDALDEHNRVVERTGLRRRALFARLRAAEPADRQDALVREAAEVETEHAVVRCELDAQAVQRLLEEPAGTEDGRLLPPVPGDPLAGWSARARHLLGRRLSRRMAAHATPRVFDDVRGLLSGVQECIGWARDIERWSAEPAGIGRCKSALYRLRVFAEVLEGHADRYWLNGARLEPIVESDELDGWIDRVIRRRERLQHHLPSPIRPLLGSVLASVEGGEGFQHELTGFARELLSIVESSGADAVPEDTGGVDAVAEATAVLHGIAGRLAAAAGERVHLEEPEQLGYSLLEEAGARALRPLVVLTAPLDVGRTPGARINLLRVVSDEQSSLPFDALRRGSDLPLRIADKIRGADLSNFGSFLSARWRANDWMWGRMDAAASLVGLLTDPYRLVQRNAHLGAEGLREALRAIVSDPAPQELGDLDDERAAQWRGFLAELWSTHADEVRGELDALFADPDDEHALKRTRKLLVERLHWTIVACELPFVATVKPGADTEGGREPATPPPHELTGEVRRYRVGRERLPDLGEKRIAALATRFGLLAYRAVRPDGTGVLDRLGRLALTLVKPLLLAVVLALAAPRRVSLVAFVAASAVMFTGYGPTVPGMQFLSGGQAGSTFQTTVSWCPSQDETAGAVACAARDLSGCPLADYGGAPCGEALAADAPSWFGLADFSGTSFGVGVLWAMLLTILFAVWLGRALMGHASGLARWLPALFITAVLLGAEGWLWSTGFRLTPLGLALVAAVLTWPATLAYRTTARIAAVAVTAVVFAATLAWVGDTPPEGGWILSAIALTGYAHVLLLATVDLLRPRPRPSG